MHKCDLNQKSHMDDSQFRNLYYEVKYQRFSIWVTYASSDLKLNVFSKTSTF